MANELEQSVLKKAQAWLDGHYDEATKKQVKYLMDNDMKELVESFYKDLEFGTGGLRGCHGPRRPGSARPRSSCAGSWQALVWQRLPCRRSCGWNPRP